MNRFCYLVLFLVVMASLGCSSLPGKIKKLELGMTPEQVKDTAGEPYAIRAAKVYDDGHTEEVWEYLANFSLYPKDYWIFFENAKLVQWGEPGDFAGSRLQAVKEYQPVKKE